MIAITKPIRRLSGHHHDGRELIVSLLPGGNISIKPHGLRNGEVTLSVGDLYQPGTAAPAAPRKVPAPAPGEPLAAEASDIEILRQLREDVLGSPITGMTTEDQWMRALTLIEQTIASRAA